MINITHYQRNSNQNHNEVPFHAGQNGYWWASLVAQRLKLLPGMQETWVQSLGQEDSLEKEMATHSSTLENPMEGGAW